MRCAKRSWSASCEDGRRLSQLKPHTTRGIAKTKDYRRLNRSHICRISSAWTRETVTAETENFNMRVSVALRRTESMHYDLSLTFIKAFIIIVVKWLCINNLLDWLRFVVLFFPPPVVTKSFQKFWLPEFIVNRSFFSFSLHSWGQAWLVM